MTERAPCDHIWIPEVKEGGELDYRPNRQMSREPTVYATCSKCNDRTWFTKEQWSAAGSRNPPAPVKEGNE